MGIRQNTHCWKCDSPDAGFLHLAWHCQPIARYWGTILRHISDITGLLIPHTPLIALLGIIDNIPPQTQQTSRYFVGSCQTSGSNQMGITTPTKRAGMGTEHFILSNAAYKLLGNTTHKATTERYLGTSCYLVGYIHTRRLTPWATTVWMSYAILIIGLMSCFVKLYCLNMLAMWLWYKHGISTRL